MTGADAQLLDDITVEDYLVIGLAACYQQEEGELKAVQVLEPIPSAYLESLFKGVPTSYQSVLGITVGAVLEQNIGQICGVPEARFCQNFKDRVLAAARTYKARPEAQALVALHQTRTDINYSAQNKRVLNLENVVTAEDNVRQHQYTHQVL